MPGTESYERLTLQSGEYRECTMCILRVYVRVHPVKLVSSYVSSYVAGCSLSAKKIAVSLSLHDAGLTCWSLCQSRAGTVVLWCASCAPASRKIFRLHYTSVPLFLWCASSFKRKTEGERESKHTTKRIIGNICTTHACSCCVCVCVHLKLNTRRNHMLKLNLNDMSDNAA